MSDETLATKSQPPSGIADADYDIIYATVSETAQGRRFLAEYARRCRPSDTEASLAAIERMQAVIRDGGTSERLQILLEMADMAQAIVRLRAEILAMPPTGSGPLDATEELDSIVQTTESATSRILNAAEQVQELAWVMRETGSVEALCDELDKQATDIYTACSFQDLTGQRTRKVIQVLRYLEERLNALVAAQETASAPQETSHKTSSLVQAGVDAVMQPNFSPPENRQDATLEDISRLMLSIEPTIAPTPSTETPNKPSFEADVRPQLSVAERVMAEDDAARKLTEWQVDPAALAQTKPEEPDAALTDWVVEDRNAPQPDAEPAWMILQRMEASLDHPAEPEANAIASKEQAPTVSAEPALFVAEAMSQLAQELRPISLLPPPELTFRAKLPGTEPLTELATRMAAGAIALRQPHDDAERHEAVEVSALAPAEETSASDADDFLFAADETPQETPAPAATAQLSPPAEEWKAGTFPHPALVTPKALPLPEPESAPQKTAEANDPLAPIRAMSDEQKIALFS